MSGPPLVPMHPGMPPPEPPDRNGTRPELNLAGLVRQVVGIQTFLAGERRRVEAVKRKREKADQ